MKKMEKSLLKKRSKKSLKIKAKEKKPKIVKKVLVGEDEFCPTCMEWRAYEDTTGRCKVCGCLIKKIGGTKKISDEFDLKDFTNDHDETQETDEF